VLAVYASTLAIVLGSLIAGTAILTALGRRELTGLSGALGFAALVIAAPIAIRLPGHGTTAAVLIGLALLGAVSSVRRSWRKGRLPERDIRGGVVVALVVVAIASLPFIFNERVGVLGEGIYTNDQAAQLYWTDWLQTGFGPEPRAVQFGYPTGPQSVTAAAARATDSSLEHAFDGLLLAIPVLTALAALALLRDLPPVRRVVAASLAGLPYLAASFLAQSAFKETVMGLLLLAFAISLNELVGERIPRRATAVTLLLLAAAAVFTYTLPGLAWFAGALAVWVVLELVAGRGRAVLAGAWTSLRRHRAAVAIGVVVILAVAAVSVGQLGRFTHKIGNVQESAGRLSSPVWPGEALGAWTEPDFRVVRGDVAGAYPLSALGLLAATIGGLAALRRREFGIVGALAAAVGAYAGARAFGSIYVQAKALAIASPLVMLAALRALLAPRGWSRAGPQAGAGRPVLTNFRLALGAIFVVVAGISTLLALRATPMSFDERGHELESLASKADGHSLLFLGVDRFAGYWLRDTLIASPGGYVPPEVRTRPQKRWQQGRAMDLDTVRPRTLDRFDYAITTRAGYQSTPPANMELVATTDSYELWKRAGPTPRLRVLNEEGSPGETVKCQAAGRRITSQQGQATVLDDPVIGLQQDWSRTSPFDAPGSTEQKLELPGAGGWELSLQYHSQVPLTVTGPGLRAELPPSLDGMYLTHQAQGAFWEAGRLRSPSGGPAKITVSAAEPSALQRALGVKRQVWLGPIAATRPGSSRIALSQACGRYLDHYLRRG
jgi:hypothetical protein